MSGELSARRDVLRVLAASPPQTTEQKRAAVGQLRSVGYRVVAACRLVGIPVSTYYLRTTGARDPGPLLIELARLRTEFPAAGYRLLTARLRAGGLRVNPKRVYRLCRAAGWLRRRVADPPQGEPVAGGPRRARPR